MGKSLVDITRTYPGIKGRKYKKAFRQTMTYDALGLTPFSPNKHRHSHRLAPRRGDRIILKDGRLGTFVGIDPTGKVWCAMDEYKMQFPFERQRWLFDLIWRNKK